MDNIGILIEMIILNILPLGSESDHTSFKKSTSILPALVGLKRNQQNEKISDYNYFGAKEKKITHNTWFSFRLLRKLHVYRVYSCHSKSSSKIQLEVQLENLTRNPNSVKRQPSRERLLHNSCMSQHLKKP